MWAKAWRAPGGGAAGGVGVRGGGCCSPWVCSAPRRAVRVARWALLLAVALLGTATAAPQLLAWPYRAEIGHTLVYSEKPIPPEMRAVLARSDALLARSPLVEPGVERSLFLTDGGW